MDIVTWFLTHLLEGFLSWLGGLLQGIIDGIGDDPEELI